LVSGSTTAPGLWTRRTNRSPQRYCGAADAAPVVRSPRATDILHPVKHSTKEHRAQAGRDRIGDLSSVERFTWRRD
jgi:hypothetical protein